MSGSLPLPRVIPVPRIRAEARFRGFKGDAFDAFVTILTRIDDEFVTVSRKRELQQAEARARQGAQQRRR